MIKAFPVRSALLLAAALPGMALIDAANSGASAKGACTKNQDIVFTEDATLTSGLNGGIVNCWVSEGDGGTALRLSKKKNDCWVESWGKCPGNTDEGWVRLRKIRPAR
jgi:hypothetical protein